MKRLKIPINSDATTVLKAIKMLEEEEKEALEEAKEHQKALFNRIIRSEKLKK